MTDSWTKNSGDKLQRSSHSFVAGSGCIGLGLWCIRIKLRRFRKRLAFRLRAWHRGKNYSAAPSTHWISSLALVRFLNSAARTGYALFEKQ